MPPLAQPDYLPYLLQDSQAMALNRENKILHALNLNPYETAHIAC